MRPDVFTVFLALQTVLPARTTAVDPFAFFRPSIVVSVDDRRQLDRGEAIARVVSGSDREIAVFAAVRVDIDGDRLVAWTRHIAELKKSPYVLAIGRFSAPPRIEDLEGLTLEDEDLSAIRRCRPGDCGLKLTSAEMDRLEHTLVGAGGNWKPALQDAFRHIVLWRVQDYVANGDTAPGFSSLLRHSPFLTSRLPQFTEYLDRYPHRPMADVESFIYWSKERLGGQPMIRVIHVGILRTADGPLPDALVAGKEIFTTHYINASLGLTAIMRGGPGARNYLAYVNRSDIDVVRGVFGGLVRWFMERRLTSEASGVLLGLRRRLESGDPDP